MPTEQDLTKFGFREPEYDEEAREASGAAQVIYTGYPKPLTRYRMIVEGFNISIEEPYFWVLDYVRYMWGFPFVDKITDIFTAAENSAFFGASQQKIGAQQDKVSQFLATIGKMVKELFQLVRELRVLDERLGYYTDSYTTSPSSESAEITLKGIWIDMVEQGAKNPASVYGMAREVQFTTLPDLFFSTHPKKQEDVDTVVDTTRAQFNRKVREVLKRKLRSFLAWKEHTFNELKNRRVFTLKFLRQHFEIIKMYMTWVKPYLKNIQRLQMDQSKLKEPDILVAFETSILEAEILARKPKKVSLGRGKDEFYERERTLNQVVLIHFLFRTRPEMSYTQEYQKGPLHIGRVAINFRSYVWNDKQIEDYMKMKEKEDLELLGVIDSSVKAAMEALGDELMRYLAEAGEEMTKKTEKKEVKPKLTSPYKSMFMGFGDMFKSGKPAGSKPFKLTKNDNFKLELAKSSMNKNVKDAMWGIYHHFKKHHGMLNW